MTAVISGNVLGLGLSSVGVLGQRGVLGDAGTGRSAEQAYVNAATGNLVLQDQDELLVRHGLDVGSVRTYNSLGQLSDDNADNWSLGVYSQQLKLSGARNAAGSTLVRTERDGGQASYTWDATRSLYVSTAGAGAYDTIVYDSTSTQYVWTDGDTGVQERYDSAATGRLLSRRDSSGNTVSYAYNASGLLVSVGDTSGEATYYDYSGTKLTQIRSVYLNAGVSTTLTRVRYGYDTSNRLSTVTVDLSPTDNAITDGKTYVTTYTYDGTSKRVASVAQGDGTSQSFTYVLVGSDYRVASVKDALNQTTSFSYDTVLRRTTVTDPLGLQTKLDYDTAGQLTKVTAPAVGGVSASTTFTYNANGDLTQTVDGEGRTLDMVYDASGNLTLQRDGAGNTVTRSYDARNQLITQSTYLVADPDGAGTGTAGSPTTTRYVYDAAGKNQLRFVLTPEGRVSEYQYNSYGERTVSVQYGAAAYAVAGLATTAVPTEAQMVTWSGTQDKTLTQREDLAYDARGLLQTQTTYSSVASTGAGVADGTQSITQYVYDQAGLLLKTVSATAGTTQYTYDGLGRQLSQTDALNQVSLTTYDDTNRKTTLTLANGLVTASSYDKASRLISVLQSNAAAQTLGETRYSYDADGRLRMTQDPTGVRTWMLYDEAGRKVADIDATGSLVEYVYDKNNQLTQTIAYAIAVNTSTLVDINGNPTNPSLVSARPLANPADRKTWRSYDAANRLVKTVDEAGAVTETVYDGASRLTKVIGYAKPITTSALTSTPTPASIAPTADAADRVSRTFYDNDGRILGALDGEGYLSENQYDSAGRLVATIAYTTQTDSTNWASGTLTQLRPASAAGDIRSVMLYDARGLAVGLVDAENYLTEKVYDGAGNLTKTVRYATQLVGTVATTATLAGIRPVANAEDQVTSWVYDKLNRVTQQTNAEGTVTQYAYDSVGHLITTTRAVGATEVRAINARYDLQGRLVGELSAEGAALLTAGQTQVQLDTLWSQYGLTHTYDAAGRRTSTTDPNGNKTLFFYDVDGHQTHTVNALGEVQENQYNPLGQLSATVRYGTRIALTGLSGGLVSAALTSAVAGVANTAKDSKTSYTYKLTGDLASSTDELGNTSSIDYNAFGEEKTRVTALGAGLTRTDSRGYDRRGLQTSTGVDTAGLNLATSAVYDAFGRLTKSYDANNNLSQRSYDRLGRMVQTIDPLNATRSTTYDAFDRVLTQTDALNKVTTASYNTSNRSLSVTTPEGVVTSTVRTRHGQTLSITDGNQKTTSYSYDRNGNLLQTTSALNTTDQQSFDRAGRLIETTDANGIKTAYTFDAANRVLTRQVDSAGLKLTTTYTYDAKGQKLSIQDPNLVVTTLSYDLGGRVLTQTLDATGLNLRTLYTYDPQGHTLSVTDPNGTVTQYTYDKLGRRTKEQIDPAGLNLTTQYTYDKNGNVVTKTDANTNVTRYAYDAGDRLIYTVDPAGGVSLNEYDKQGRVVRTTGYATAIDLTGLATPATVTQIQAKVTASAGKDAVQANRYDNDGRLRFTVDGTGAVTEYRYDANGNVVDRIDYASTINLATWNATTDPAPIANVARDLRTRTVYDELNRATYSADGLGAVTQKVYDKVGNVTQVVQYANTVLSTVSPSAVVASVTGTDRSAVYVYDSAGRLTSTTNAVGAVTKLEYDANGNVVKHTDWAGAAASTTGADRVTVMTYDKANRLVYTVDALNYVQKNSYDKQGRISATTRYATAIAAGVVPTDTTVVKSATLDRTDSYTYDAVGRLKTHTDALGNSGVLGQTESYTYDGLGNKLTFTNKKGSVWNYAYDAAGHLVKETSPQVALTVVSTAPNGNLVEGTTSNNTLVTEMSYDGLGNLLSRTEGKVYDTAGVLVSDFTPRTTSYAYDARGRQVKVTYPSVGVYSETTAAATTNGATSLAARADLPKALTTQTYYDALGNAVANVDVAGSVSSKAYDAAGRLRYEVDALGFVTGYTRNAFGEAESTVRYAVATTLSNTTPTSAAQAPTAAQITTALAALAHTQDRTLLTQYDKLGRVAQVTEPSGYVYDSSEAAANPYPTAGKTTKNTYNTFGELVQVSQLKNSATNSWITTTHYVDKLGRETATVDAMGYLTTRGYDSVGNLTTQTEWANTVAAGWTTSIYTAGAASATQDRRTDYAWDLLNRKVSDTRLSVETSTDVEASTGTSTARNLVNTYGYDAVGNLTRTTDASGASVYSYYDALGRVTAVAAPTRNSTVAGTALIPLTVFRRDAYGNVVVKIEQANGAATAAEFTGVSRSTNWGVTFGAADTVNDRRVLSAFDSMGHATQVADANGVNHYSSYTERGEVAKTWQAVSEDRGNGVTTTTTLFQVNQYDKLGHITHVITPGANEALNITPNLSYTSAYWTTFTTESNSWDGWSGPNSINLDLTNVIDPHGGTVRVQVDYKSLNQTARTKSLDVAVNTAIGGVALSWTDSSASAVDGGIASITNVRVLQLSGTTWVSKWQGTGLQAVGQGTAAATAALIDTALEYNAFGELTNKGINGGRQEYFDYDSAGRMWRSNTGDGVDKILLYDLLGRQTAEVRSSGSGRDDRDLKLLASADQAVDYTTSRRTDKRYDDLGHLLTQTLPERQIVQGGVGTVKQVNFANVFTTSSPGAVYVWQGGDAGYEVFSHYDWVGQNQINASWASLGNLGAGDVRVQVDYQTSAQVLSPAVYDENILVSPATYAPIVSRSQSWIFTAEEALTGHTLIWTDSGGNSGGVSSVSRMQVQKKDALGIWRTVVDTTSFGYTGGKTIEIATPSNPDTKVRLAMRAAGSTGAYTYYTALSAAELVTLGSNAVLPANRLFNFGNALRFNASALVLGNYEYVVLTTEPGQAERTSDSGTVSLTATGITQKPATIADPYVRPVVSRTFDRWGNLLTVSDPRNAAWVTSYRYNASNQMIEQNTPDPRGTATTRVFYDKLGHQIAVKDALGRINTQSYDAAGNLVQEGHADGGKVSYRYNAFGERVQMQDALANASTDAVVKADHTTSYTYDRMGHVLSTTLGNAEVWSMSNAWVLTGGTKQAITEYFTYDEAGRKISFKDASGAIIRYRYDRLDHIIETTSALGAKTRVVYDMYGRKSAEIDANKMAQTWTQDYFGLVQSHTDLGGELTTYVYDKARQLVSQKNTRYSVTTPLLSYTYDAAGQLLTVSNAELTQKTIYAYDLAGNHVLERTTQQSLLPDGVTSAIVTYQDNHLAYDEVGRLRDVSDERVHISLEYDKLGNRTLIKTHVNLPSAPGAATDTSQDTARYFQYDAMNRQTVVDATDAQGTINAAQGHKLTYDLAGNRLTDRYFDQALISGTSTFQSLPSEIQESYAYDGLNRLVKVTRSDYSAGVLDQRRYDAVGRVVQSGPTGLSNAYAESINAGVALAEALGKEVTQTIYNADGRTLSQRTLNATATASKSLVDYTSGYDAAGNAGRYVVTDYASGAVINYVRTLQRYDSYREVRMDASSNKTLSGVVLSTLDALGNLRKVDDTTRNTLDRNFVNDLAGRALYDIQTNNVQRQLIVNGEVLGRYGVGIDPAKPKDTNGNPVFATLAQFDFGYQKVSGNYPSGQAPTYTVALGDTLRSVARATWGDENLWFRIADANGLTSERDLKVGQTLIIPSGVTSSANRADSFRPYDPSKITGDTNPNLPPVPTDFLDVLLQIVIIVIIVVVAVQTGEYVKGLEALKGAAWANAIAGAAGGAAGAAAGQVASMAAGLSTKFDWNAVAVAAIGGAVNGANALDKGAKVGDAITKAAVSSAITQGIAVVTGLQKNFSWRSVVASAAGAGVGKAIGESLAGDQLPAGQAGPALPAAFSDLGSAGSILRASLSGMAAGLTTATMRGGRVSVEQVAIDAFGNALGDSLVEEMKYSVLPDEVRAMPDAARDHALRLARDFRIDLSDPMQIGDLVDTMRMVTQGIDLGVERREEITTNALRRAGLSEQQISSARQLYAGQGLLGRDRVSTALPAASFEADGSDHDGVLTPPRVEIVGSATDAVLGAKPVDRMAMGVGGVVRDVHTLLADNPWMGIAVNALQFLAAPLTYVANQALAVSSIGQAIEEKLGQVHENLTERFVDANYGVDNAVDGASGAMTVGSLAAGFSASNAMALVGIAAPKSSALVSSRLRPGQDFKLSNVQDKYPDIALTADIRRQMGPKPPDMVNAHEHHILEVNGRPGEHRALVREGQDILREYGIDPLHGSENLIYAPNKGHTLTNAESLVNELRAAKSLGLPREKIVMILRDAGEEASKR